MKRLKKITFMAIMGLGVVLFNGCQKDTENIYLNSQASIKTKSIGSHQQPTSIIDINTTVNIQNIVHLITGSAEIGNYDGRIYECNAMWIVHLDEINEDFPLHLAASLKPEFEDLTIEVEPLMENYIITVNSNHVEPNFVLMENEIEVVDYNTIFELWIEIVQECNDNVIIMGRPNPYNFVGQLHNDALDYIAATCDLEELSGQDINNAVNNFLQSNFINYVPVSYTKFKQHLDEADELAAALYTSSMSFESILSECNAEDVGNILDRLTELFRNIDASNGIILPNNFENEVIILENEVISLNKHNNPEETLEMNIYSAALATLSIAKYSYEYWYNAKMEPEHPWYSLVQAKDGDEPGFFKKLWNGICTAANAVWDALCTPIADAYGAWITLEKYTYMDENGEISYGYKGDIIDFYRGGIDASAAIWAK
ncbi:MAG: hypothetical protein GX330_08155 [Bacteroidales bacterium]|nr:hypothetical protein [Bacteroidales bacterium]